MAPADSGVHRTPRAGAPVSEFEVIVSHAYKYIFLKTRKTAGTSIEIALSQFCGDGDIITPIAKNDQEKRKAWGYPGPQNCLIPVWKYRLGDWENLLLRRRRARFFNHTAAWRVRSALGRRVWDSYFKFCVERNPWDKAVSLYYWRTRNMEPRPTFLEFLRSVSPSSLSNYHIYSIDGCVAVDRVVPYERLESGLDQIARMLGMPVPLELPSAKAGFRKEGEPYRVMFGPEEREIVADICAKEAACFGYTLEAPHKIGND